ncbi:MAG TPA: hypothetical protein DCS93_09750 [Microscillaceae bacterium]|nr:hypothetical protein [Microscillaceae bacterium]
MAAIVNKMLRVIPKKDKIEDIDCHQICTNLAETGGELWEKVVYYINEEENCLDIKYKSRKGRGDLGIEDRPNQFDIWVIENSDGGDDIITCLNSHQYDLDAHYNTNLYCFEEIRIVGNQAGLLQDFYPHFFYFEQSNPPNYLQKALDTKDGNCIKLDQKGIYNAGTIYDVGEKFSRIPEALTKSAFFGPRQVPYFEAEFLLLSNQNYGLTDLIQSAVSDKFTKFDWDKNNLFEIQFWNKGRMVKKIETGQHWTYFNAEFFDNTIEQNWIEYLSLWKRGLV